MIRLRISSSLKFLSPIFSSLFFSFCLIHVRVLLLLVFCSFYFQLSYSRISLTSLPSSVFPLLFWCFLVGSFSLEFSFFLYIFFILFLVLRHCSVSKKLVQFFLRSIRMLLNCFYSPHRTVKFSAPQLSMKLKMSSSSSPIELLAGIYSCTFIVIVFLIFVCIEVA